MNKKILFLLLPAWFVTASVSADEWPDPNNPNIPYALSVIKVAGEEITDVKWMHLHHNHATAVESTSVRIGLEIHSEWDIVPAAQSGIQVYYTMRGVQVSPVLDPPFQFDLSIDNPAIAGFDDGFHDLSVVAIGARRMEYKPAAAFVHLTRGNPLSDTVPILLESPSDRPQVLYANRTERSASNFPVNPNVQPWTEPPFQADLMLEMMAPHTGLFEPAQMWWQDPPHPGKPFLRALAPKTSNDDYREIRPIYHHGRMPAKDGPRGEAWISNLTSGQIDERGRFAFAEIGGRVGYMMPDGEVVTVAGWRVQPGKDPVWVAKPLDTVRKNMELRGRWTEGQYPGENGGFRTPLDVAIDPNNENIWYVIGSEDNCVWKVQINNLASNDVVVSVFAGDPGHQGGFVDGNGHTARFNGPTSIVFDPTRDVLYVADSDNDAIRRITRSGDVTTLFGAPGMEGRLISRGTSNIFDQTINRNLSQFEVSAAQAIAGTKPETFIPMCVRVMSDGDIILLDTGYGSIRRINPVTLETRLWANPYQKFQQFSRGWAWLDVDRWGNSGPKDGIYWCKSVGASVDGEPGEDRFNEVFAWVPPTGGQSKFVFGNDLQWYPDGWGKVSETNAPHYPWLVAVDPRGGLMVSGIGEHGTCRLRKRRATDLDVPTNLTQYDIGKRLWNGSYEFRNKGVPSTLKFGQGTNNYIGVGDTWRLDRGISDDALLDYFEAAPYIRNSASYKASWLYFVRTNIQVQERGTTDGSPPSTPANFRITASDANSITFGWNPSTDNVGVVGYRIDISAAENFSSVVVTAAGNGIAFRVLNLQPDTNYYARIRAIDTSGNASGNSAAISGRTIPFGPPPSSDVIVSAGLDMETTFPKTAELHGSLLLHGQENHHPVEALIAWTKVSGPGDVTFTPANSLHTAAGFTAAGRYIVRLVVTIAGMSWQDEAAVTVKPAIGGAGAGDESNRNVAMVGKPAAVPECWGPKLYNRAGVAVDGVKTTATGVELYAEDMASGMYFLKCSGESGTHKIVVVK